MHNPFERIFGNNASLRLIQFLLPLSGVAFSVEELSEELKISSKHTQGIIDKFLEWGLLYDSGGEGYVINEGSSLVQRIEDLNNSIISIIVKDDVGHPPEDYVCTAREAAMCKTRHLGLSVGYENCGDCFYLSSPTGKEFHIREDERSKVFEIILSELGKLDLGDIANFRLAISEIKKIRKDMNTTTEQE